MVKILPWLRSLDLVVLLSLVAILAGVWLFIALAYGVGAGSTQHLDEQLLLALRNSENLEEPLGPPLPAIEKRRPTFPASLLLRDGHVLDAGVADQVHGRAVIQLDLTGRGILRGQSLLLNRDLRDAVEVDEEGAASHIVRRHKTLVWVLRGRAVNNRRSRLGVEHVQDVRQLLAGGGLGIDKDLPAKSNRG